MRALQGLFVVIASVLLCAVALAAPAAADPNGPGNNGTVKIVNDGDDPITADDRDNDPHVCHFHVFGFHFDSNSSGTWRIDRWAPTGTGTAASGGWQADASGAFHVPGPALADGHYKLFVKQTVPAAPGGDKQKVFWVSCAAQAPANATPAATPATPTPTPTGMAGVNGAAGTTATPAPTQLGFQVNNGLPGGSNQTNGGSLAGTSGTATAGTETNATVAGVTAGVQTLPSTSTAPEPPLAAAGLLIAALGGLVLRRSGRRA